MASRRCSFAAAVAFASAATAAAAAAAGGDPATCVSSPCLALTQAQTLLETLQLGQRLQHLAELRQAHATCGSDLVPLLDALRQAGPGAPPSRLGSSMLTPRTAG